MRLLFIGHNGYGYPHTRVRCYHFAKILQRYDDVETAVLSFRDDLAPDCSEAAMYESLRDRGKLKLTFKALGRLLSKRDTILYIQKAHFHAAAPFLLHRLGLAPRYILDYDDYDIPLSNFFSRGIWNRLFFGSNQWDEITYRLAQRACGCVAASHQLVDVLKPHNPNVALVETGVDVEQFSPPKIRATQEPLTFFWNGLVWGEPLIANLRYMFRAFKSIETQMPDYRIKIVGGGAKWEEIQTIAHQEFPSLPIDWQDWIDPRAMPDLLRSVDVGLLPVEGDDLWLRCKSPTKLYEYMASGLPVVATAVGEVTHVIDHRKSGFLAQTEKEFAQGLLETAVNHSRREAISQQARKRIEERYALPVLGERLHQFLHQLFD